MGGSKGGMNGCNSSSSPCSSYSSVFVCAKQKPYLISAHRYNIIGSSLASVQILHVCITVATLHAKEIACRNWVICHNAEGYIVGCVCNSCGQIICCHSCVCTFAYLYIYLCVCVHVYVCVDFTYMCSTCGLLFTCLNQTCYSERGD